MSKFVFDSIFAAKIYPIFTILFTLKYIRDQKLNNRFLLSLSKKTTAETKTRRFSEDVLSHFHDCGQVCFPSLSTFFRRLFSKFRWKVGFRSWLHARCIARDTALHPLRLKKIKFDFEIISLNPVSVSKLLIMGPYSNHWLACLSGTNIMFYAEFDVNADIWC